MVSFNAMVQKKIVILENQKVFYLAVSPAKQKNVTLRPLSLCGENPILDEMGSNS
jgi:hypothetical protein